MKIELLAAVTDAGPRQLNEDAVLALEDVPLFAVADGMGGADAGDIAASTALDTLRLNAPHLHDLARELDTDQSSARRLTLMNLLETTFRWAHLEIEREASRRSRAGMATTLLAAAVAGECAFLAHVGNSRAYLWRDEHLRRLTDDHTLAMLRFRHGSISVAELRGSPDRNRLYQAIGAGGEVDVDTAQVTLADGDLLLLCSDGLTDALSEDQLAVAMRELLESGPPQALGAGLVELAKRHGGRDNISLVLLRFSAERSAASVEDVAEVMRSVFLFADLPESERLLVAPYLEEHTWQSGQVLMRAGDAADDFHVIVEGCVAVTRGGAHIADLGAGAHFGELALARPVARSATATALAPTRTLSLSRDRFWELVRRRPHLGAALTLRLLDAVGDRLRDLIDRLAEVERLATDTPTPGTLDRVLATARGVRRPR